MRLFSYKMTVDAGFAPNPWWGILTLATCKPQIRRTKRPSDWIAGFTSLRLCGDPVGEERLVFLMQVAEKLPVADYFRDSRFRSKIPRRRPVGDPSLARDRRVLLGDNLYEPLTKVPKSYADYRQVRNPSHGPQDVERDLSGQYVLIATRFVYFGSEAIRLPKRVRPDLPVGQTSAGRQTADPRRVDRFIRYVESKAGLERVVVAMPHASRNDDLMETLRSSKRCSSASTRQSERVPRRVRQPKCPA